MIYYILTLFLLSLPAHGDVGQNAEVSECGAALISVGERNMKDIRRIYKYNEVMFIRYHDDERAKMEKLKEQDPNIEILMTP